jgi:cytochrome c-type biogenesis protein CcmF
MQTHGEGALQAFLQAQRRGRRRFGAYVAHAGAVVVIVAIAVSSTMGSSKEIELRQGESTEIGSYRLTFVKAEEMKEPHRQSLLARIEVSRGGRSLGMLLPRMSQYEGQREPIGTPAVRSSLTEDLYLSIHNIDPDAGTVGLLVLVNPMVGWIWIATAVIAMGGVLALLPPFRRAPAPSPAALAATVPSGGSHA